MISFFKHIFDSFSNNIKNIYNNEDDKLNLNKEYLLKEIQEIRQNGIIETSAFNITYNEHGCFYKTGTISFVNNNYVLIENQYICEIKNIMPIDLKVGDKVYYIAYKISENEELKIYRIISKINTSWDEIQTEICNKNQISKNKLKDVNLNTCHTDVVLNQRQLNERIILGKVDKRKGRDIFLEDNTCVNLDNVSSTFIPMIGDWIQLECIVELNEEVSNLQGEILEIKSISPLRHIRKLGKITEYNSTLKFGIIDNVIIFTKEICRSGYIPHAGDKVVVQSIESDQRLNKQWRALSVVPLNVFNKVDNTISKVNNRSWKEINELLKNKEDIEITDKINIHLKANNEKIIEIYIKNNGNVQQNIYKCILISKSKSQLILISPKYEQHLLKPLEEIIYQFKCKARFVGTFEELVIFKFDNFNIGRIFHIVVQSIELQQISGKKNPYISNVNFNKSIIELSNEEGTYIKGMKPYRLTKFIPNRPVTWKIPDILWITINEIIEEQLNSSESKITLLRNVPTLEQQLNFENYKQRFDYLLYLEEIAQKLYIKKFNMPSAIMFHSGEYLTLNVPGLLEKRPSLLIGDRVIVSFKWHSQNDELNYEGYIHKINNSNIYLKFHQDFHEMYNGEDCQINFKISTNVFQRCHVAISVVINSLGPEFLFPTKVVEKKSQYNFIEIDDEIKHVEFIKESPNVIIEDVNIKKKKIFEESLYKKKLSWYNKNLNIYQKKAIINILKGLACPLPYIIFGPPGTGKTITVCEAILQILFLISESRILVATPTNSSANLITERLLDSKLLKPGNLVRLVGYNYFRSDSIPKKIIPYCVTANISNHDYQSNEIFGNTHYFRSNASLHVICHHRIVIGTCSSIGILYNMGCTPGHFTHIIIDEAGQPNEPEVMIPLSLAHLNKTQIVLAGDPEQLGPINQSQLANFFGLSDSFLSRLLQHFPYQRDLVGFNSGYDPRLVTKLLMNYRSLPTLLDPPNELFYENELIPQVDPKNSYEAKLLNSVSDILPKIVGNTPSIVFHNINGKNLQDSDSPSWYNSEEATQVYIYLLDLYNHGFKSNDIGIIAPYSKQVYKIKCLLTELEVEIPKVGSVEEFQGQERNVIILSVVRTAGDKIEEDIKHALGFIGAKKRLNVAITRARALLIIIGNSYLLQQDYYWSNILDYCLSRGSYIDLEKF